MEEAVILLIDNYDSFTYNLYHYLGELGAEARVFLNNKITVEEIATMKPEKIVISPGPCTPREAGISCEIITRFGEKTPILGVCLGHQCIGAAFGAMRYHSLVINPERLPADLNVSAHTAYFINIYVDHRKLPIEGVQFHPE